MLLIGIFNLSLRDIAAKAKLLSFALTYCNNDMIQPVLQVFPGGLNYFKHKISGAHDYYARR